MEEWRTIREEYGPYEVSSLGRVRHALTGRFFSQHPDDNGYLRFCAKAPKGRRTLRVHRLVAEAFHGPRPSGLVVRHLNGDQRDNRADNLRYGTLKQNWQDALDHGYVVQRKGEDNPRAKITADDVKEIRQSSESTSALAVRFGLSLRHVNAIQQRVKWKHVA